VLNKQLSRETANLKCTEAKLKKEITERSSIEKQLNKNMPEPEQTQQATLNIMTGNGQSGKAEFSGNILVAEDARTNQVLIKSLLERLGLQVTVVEDGNKAVQQALSQQFDLIFMDIEMPNINGYEAAKTIRKKGLKTPIIALTAYAMKGDEENCFEAGCNDYISKPIEHKKFLNILGKYLLKGDKDMSRRIHSLKSDVDQINKLCSESPSTGNESTEPVDEKIPVDLETIQKIYDDQEILKEIVMVFLEDAPQTIKLLAEAITAGDYNNVKLYAHKLRGLARHVAAIKLSDMLLSLETKARQAELQGSETLFAEIQTEFDKLKSFLSQPDWFESAVQQTNRNETATKA
jgi:CheY-like chemotaxis protein/HPt (histidine-containing phosphotransfer) domain-containing protein